MTDLLVEAGLLPLAGLSRAEQRAHAEERARRALARVPLTLAPLVPSPRDTGARARVKLRAGPGGALGYHRAGTHDWVHVPADALTLLARPELVEAAARVEAWGGAQGEVELRSDGTKVAVVLDHGAPGAATCGEHVVVGKRTVAGDPTLRVNGLRVSPRSFYQVNLEMNEAIVAHVDAVLQRLAPTRLLDLYAGVGNLSARAIARGTPATLVESDPSSSADARVNCKGADVRSADVSRMKAGEHFFDVAVLDPPRAGAPGVLERLLVTRPRAVVYLSCEPTTLARDLGAVVRAGYRITEAIPWEMFPGSDHVETLVLAER
jgi:tRNA/tmRNA/rRNA uracil-C5-methylase (TrmA/RlmC/RlmD family)